jgi:hypothetical protein
MYSIGMNTSQAPFSSTADRILLHVTLAAGYAFLAFFGWLLTL